MRRKLRIMTQALLLFFSPFMASGISACSMIDEDLSECGVTYEMDYEMELITNMTTELSTQFGLAANVNVTAALKPFLQTVFTDFAHDVYLSFYGTEGDMPLQRTIDQIIDGNQSSFTLYIPIRNYMHLAVANLEGDNAVEMQGRDFCKMATLQQEQKDTVSSHTTGLFTARLPMDMKEGVDQHFNVTLYMANCASALVLDTLGSGIKDVRVYASGFATSYSVADSTYSFRNMPIVKTEKIEVAPSEGDEDASLLCYACVTFPSRMEPETKVIIETTDPFVAEMSDTALWNYRVYCTLADGTVTETLLGVYLPLHPGQFKIITARVLDTGACVPDNSYVGASVCLNWNEQINHEIIL